MISTITRNYTRDTKASIEAEIEELITGLIKVYGETVLAKGAARANANIDIELPTVTDVRVAGDSGRFEISTAGPRDYIQLFLEQFGQRERRGHKRVWKKVTRTKLQIRPNVDVRYFGSEEGSDGSVFVGPELREPHGSPTRFRMSEHNANLARITAEQMEVNAMSNNPTTRRTARRAKIRGDRATSAARRRLAVAEAEEERRRQASPKGGYRNQRKQKKQRKQRKQTRRKNN